MDGIRNIDLGQGKYFYYSGPSRDGKGKKTLNQRNWIFFYKSSMIKTDEVKLFGDELCDDE